MKPIWPTRTLAALAGALAIDGVLIGLAYLPSDCNANGSADSGLGGLLVLLLLAWMIGAPSALIAVGIRDATMRGASYAYLVTTVGLPAIVVAHVFTLGAALTAGGCGGSFMILGG